MLMVVFFSVDTQESTRPNVRSVIGFFTNTKTNGGRKNCKVLAGPRNLGDDVFCAVLVCWI